MGKLHAGTNFISASSGYNFIPQKAMPVHDFHCNCEH